MSCEVGGGFFSWFLMTLPSLNTHFFTQPQTFKGQLQCSLPNHKELRPNHKNFRANYKHFKPTTKSLSPTTNISESTTTVFHQPQKLVANQLHIFSPNYKNFEPNYKKFEQFKTSTRITNIILYNSIYSQVKYYS